ncbi:MAG: 4-oxalocrotonate tautomerase [Variovorax sp.]|nr:4-oxalocrotonate tautomerase [Variovorax sp.]
MPTYTVSAHAGALSAEVKQRIASRITRTHNEVTGAQSFFAQVIFVDVAAGDWFMGGAPAAPNTVFVHGQIRGGRTAEMKLALLTGLLDTVASAGDLPKTSVWVYIVELPAAHMAEYGHVLPEPGSEAHWLTALPAGDRALMESTGRNPQT